MTGLTGAVTQATLSITSANYAGADTVSAPDVKLVTGSWTEATITWNTRPTVGAIVASGGTIWPVNTSRTWDVSIAVTGNGTVSLMLAPNSTDGANANSREQTSGKPTLTVSTCTAGSPPSPTPTATPTATPGPTNTPAAGDVSLVTVGDIACKAGSQVTSNKCQQMATSDIALSANPDAVIVSGDIQYECATASDFAGSYDPSWGRLKGITYPVLGNHEYTTSLEAPAPHARVLRPHRTPVATSRILASAQTPPIRVACRTARVITVLILVPGTLSSSTRRCAARRLAANAMKGRRKKNGSWPI